MIKKRCEYLKWFNLGSTCITIRCFGSTNRLMGVDWSWFDRVRVARGKLKHSQEVVVFRPIHWIHFFVLRFSFSGMLTDFRSVIDGFLALGFGLKRNFFLISRRFETEQKKLY
jgi:hypothetical protein